jgi:hypothetical protein
MLGYQFLLAKSDLGNGPLRPDPDRFLLAGSNVWLSKNAWF